MSARCGDWSRGVSCVQSVRAAYAGLRWRTFVIGKNGTGAEMPKRTKGRANGEGSIYEYPQDSGIWFAEVSLANGNRRKRRATSQREAREKLKHLQAEIDRGVDLTSHQPTVAEWCTT
jgi:hypothetical protein